MNIDIRFVSCKRCGYDWAPRKIDVRLCPKCQSPYWDRERTQFPAMKKDSEYRRHERVK